MDDDGAKCVTKPELGHEVNLVPTGGDDRGPSDDPNLKKHGIYKSPPPPFGAQTVMDGTSDGSAVV